MNRSRAIFAALLTIVLVAGEMPAITAADTQPHVWRGQTVQPPPPGSWRGRAPGVRHPAPLGAAITGSQVGRLPGVIDARTGKTLPLTATATSGASRSGAIVATSAVRRTMDVQPPSSAGCHDYGGDVWACDVVPGMSYDLPVSSTIESYSDPSWVCSAASPVFYFAHPSPHGISVSLLSASGSSSCGSTWTGVIRVTLSAQAPWEDNGLPDVTFKLIYTLCKGTQCTTGQNGLAQTGGTRYSFFTPYPAHGFPAIPERDCGRCNGTTTGKPIDVTTGEVWNEKTDLALSGPFGLSFTRFYGNQTAGSADLGGTNWLHTYAAVLDVSALSNGNVTYWDNHGMPFYFASVATGASSYDNVSGMTLALSSDGSSYSLTSFDGQNETFDAKGELVALHDRVGNTQTLTRDAANANRIASVADFAGRQLCFYYDSANRIIAVAAWMSVTACPSTAPSSSVATPVVTLGYNTGVNCSANSLCAVTEPDGQTWTYQYTAADTTYPYNLTEVLDPLGDPEEINGYSGNRIVHQETGSCAGSSPCSDTGGFINITYPTSGSTVTITDGLSRTSTIVYDPNSLLLTSISGPVCKCGGDQTRTYTYDTYGRAKTVSDDGVDGTTKHTLTYGYTRDANGRAYPGPTSIAENLDTSGSTRTTSVVYYPVGDARQDLPQTTTLPSVDSPGSSIVVTDTYSTTTPGLLTQRTTAGYANGAPVSYTQRWSYDSRGRLLTQTGPRTDVNQTTTYTYYADNAADATQAGQLQRVSDPLGHAFQLSAVSGFTGFSPFGDPQSVIDPNGVSTQTVYDARGRVLTNTMLPASEGDPTLVTQFNYDGAGRSRQQIRPAGNFLQFNYDTSSRLTLVKRHDASGARHERLSVTYDASDQLTSVAAQYCQAPSPSCPWTTSFSQSIGYSSTTGNLSRITNADNTYQGIGYTAQGKVASLNDENHTSGVNYSATYDIAGRRLTETRVLPGAAGGVVMTRYTYDLRNNVTSVTDPNGNVTTYHYDDFDRMIKETSPVTGVTTYTYDADNNLMSTVNANGTSTVYTYDALDRPLTENNAKGTATASEAWTYDDATAGHFGIGRLATMTDPSGSTAYTYDRRGLVEVENHSVGGNLFTYGYGYDVNGNRSTVEYPDGTIASFTFDFADRPYSAQQYAPPNGGGTLSTTRRVQNLAKLRARGLAAPPHAAKSELPPAGGLAVPKVVTLSPPARTIAAPGRGGAPVGGRSTAIPASGARRTAGAPSNSVLVTSASYAAFGPMTSLAFGNGTTQTMSYNQRYLPVENKVVANGTTIADHLYSEDAAGNVTAITDALNAGYNRNFAYDDLNRLTTANSGTSLWGTASGNGYAYDAMGNIASVKLGTGRTDTFAYKPGGSGSTGLPLLASVTENGAVRNVSYDAIGSELTDGHNTMTYGARELLGANSPNMQSYAYDGFRRRVQSQLPNGNQRVSFFDPENRLLAETALGAPPTTVAYDYVWFGGRAVAQLDPSGTHWTYADPVGTPSLQTDANGAVSWQAEHEPFGSVWSLRAADAHQPLRAPGQTSEQYDTGANGLTELSYNNARWYRPGWGRFTQADPFGVVSQPQLYGFQHTHKLATMQVGRTALDPTATNLYAYGEDLPTAMIDPSGFGSLWDFVSNPENSGGSIFNPTLPRWFTELFHGHFKIYGNFCGPGWMNGQWIPETSVKLSQIGPGNGPNSVPINKLDGCCATHDACHDGCAHGLCGPVKDCKNKCDNTLANCSSHLRSDFGPRVGFYDKLTEATAATAIYGTMRAQPKARTAWPWWPW